MFDVEPFLLHVRNGVVDRALAVSGLIHRPGSSLTDPRSQPTLQRPEKEQPRPRQQRHPVP
jgi:hypothetical protein